MGIDLAQAVRQNFSVEAKDIRTYAPLQLAYVGDAIYEIIIRTLVLEKKNVQVTYLHKAATHYVNAAAQKDLYNAISEELTEEEMGYFKRGRNAKSYTVAKHASVTDYRIATGFEALCGFLYLTGQNERLLSLVKLGIERLESPKTAETSDEAGVTEE